MTEIIHALDQLDTGIFLYLNGMHCAFFDNFMMLYSSRFVWIPFYASFLLVMLKNTSPRATLSCLVAIVCVVAASDQLTSALLKPMVERLRPSNLDNPISHLVHVVDDYRGGRYGFPSSHSANSWSMAVFAICLTRRRALGLFLSAWALLMTYTRIYLGVHYPGDLLVGMLIGGAVAVGAYCAYVRLCPSHASSFGPQAGSMRWASLPFATGLLSVAAMLVASGVMELL